MKIGIMTGGGDCPGLNAVIRAIVVKAHRHNGWDVIGILDGWRGLMAGGETFELRARDMSGILATGGTILKTSRTNPLKSEGGIDQVKARFKELELDGLIAIGGEDTLGVAANLCGEGLPVVGVPKTIDNDLLGTDQTFGFDTAVNVVVEAIDRVRTTTESHKRVMVVEVMGRHAGWIALHGGIGGGADAICIPEKPVNVDELCAVVTKRHEGGKDFSIVVVAEGAKLTMDESTDKDGSFIVQDLEKDEFGHVRLGGVSQILANAIEKRTGYESRTVILGHIQRGGAPSAFDRYMSTRFGLGAVDLIEEGRFGRMVSYRCGDFTDVDLKTVLGGIKTVTEEEFEHAEVFFG